MEKFRFWCQKVLPLVYDDSLSYYEVLCKVKDYLNATIEEVERLAAEIEKIPEKILNSEEFYQLVVKASSGKIDELYKIVQDTLNNYALTNKVPLVQNSNGAITNMFNVLMTYYHNPNLVYGNWATPFNPNPAPVSGKYEIDCSSLVQLCLMGVPYENTRYFNEDNVPWSGYYFGNDLILDPEADRPLGMLSSGMCKWFEEHGYYFETDDPSVLQPGDVVFMTFDTTSETYKHITHCAIYMGYIPITDEYWCISASKNPDNNSRPFPVSRETYQRTSPAFVGFGRLPLPDCHFIPNDLLNNGYQTVTGTQNIDIDAGKFVADAGRLRLINNLKKNKVYTLVMNVTNAHTPLFFTVQAGNVNMVNASVKEGDWIFVPFIMNFQNTNEVEKLPSFAGQYLISLYARIKSDQTGGIHRECNFKEVHLYEGIVIEPIGNVATLNTDCVMQNKPKYQPLRGDNTTTLLDTIATGLATHKFHFESVMVSDSAIENGPYMVFTMLNAVTDTVPKYGVQYLLGTNKNGIYGRQCVNGVWSALRKLSADAAG